ncbi:hypothetical protein [Laceyella sediminis]|nr:hypothetical protein [Laceyella sediminis]
MNILPQVEWKQTQTHDAKGSLEKSDLKPLLYQWYWKDRMTLSQIARELNIPTSTLQKIFVVLGIPRRPRGNMSRRKVRLLPKSELERLYFDENYKLKDILKHFSCSRQALYNNLEYYQFSKRPSFCGLPSIPKIKNLSHDQFKNQLYHLYWEKGLSIRKIAQIYETSSTTIFLWLHRFEIPTRNRRSNIKSR